MLRQCLKKIIELFPLRKIVIFESNPDFSDNTYWLYKYFVDNQLFGDYKFVWFVGDENNSKVKELCEHDIESIYVFDNKLTTKMKRYYYSYFAKIIIDCNRYVEKRRKKQVRIHLTHGMPIKDCSAYFKHIGECDLLTVSGDSFKDEFAKYVDRDVIKCLGLARNDILYSNKKCDKKFILWMPTYRQHKDSKNNPNNIFKMGIPVIQNADDLKDLDKFLEENNILLLLRMHPAQDLSVFNVSESKNILIANDHFLSENNISLYELISYSSALITDYSSVYFDYIPMHKPIALTFGDAEVYARENKLLFNNIRNDIPGFNIDTMDDMYNFIENVKNGVDKELELRSAFADKLGIKDLEACKLISEFINKKLS